MNRQNLLVIGVFVPLGLLALLPFISSGEIISDTELYKTKPVENLFADKFETLTLEYYSSREAGDSQEGFQEGLSSLEYMTDVEPEEAVKI